MDGFGGKWKVGTKYLREASLAMAMTRDMTNSNTGGGDGADGTMNKYRGYERRYGA